MLEPMSHDRERVISISLSEAEWQAFIARQPQPVSWLLDRIRDEAAATTGPQQHAATTKPRQQASSAA